jgi:hypothetical protein
MVYHVDRGKRWFTQITLEMEEKGGLPWRLRKKVVYCGDRGKRWFTLEIGEKSKRAVVEELHRTETFHQMDIFC